MITKDYAYNKALEEKRLRVKQREFEHSVRMKGIYSSEPRLVEIDNQLMKIGAQTAVTALSGNMEKLENFKKESLALSEEKKQIFKKFNFSESGFECSICSDTGYVSGKICSCIKKEAARIISEELSKEMPIDKCSFDNFDLKYYPDVNDKEGNPRRRMTAILKLCREYVIGFDPSSSENLLFTGNSGLGKTHLTMAIVAGVIEKGYLPVYGSAENLFSVAENEKFSSEGKGSCETMLNCDLLVIDDLGAEMVTSFTKSVLYNLVNTRILSGKPTIINTNLTMKEIENLYTARISSRLIGEYNSNRFIGPDIRQQKLLERKG